MARERTAEDQALAVLAQSAVPLLASDIASRLRWGKSMISKVLARLGERLHITRDATDGSGGRPALKYSLRRPDAEPRLGVPQLPRFETDTFVITPLDREARVKLHRRDGYVEFVYIDKPVSEGCLPARLLRAFQPGRERPKPVRIV